MFCSQKLPTYKEILIFNLLVADVILIIVLSTDGYQNQKSSKAANDKSFSTLLAKLILREKSMEQSKCIVSLD